jgi:hypothetical protein
MVPESQKNPPSMDNIAYYTMGGGGKSIGERGFLVKFWSCPADRKGLDGVAFFCNVGIIILKDKEFPQRSVAVTLESHP